MTAEQTAENIKTKIDELANKAAERMDTRADVAADHDWLDPRVRRSRNDSSEQRLYAPCINLEDCA